MKTTSHSLTVRYQCGGCGTAFAVPSRCICGALAASPITSALLARQAREAAQAELDQVAMEKLKAKRLTAAPFADTSEFDPGPPPDVKPTRPRSEITGRTIRTWRDDQGERSKQDLILLGIPFQVKGRG